MAERVADKAFDDGGSPFGQAGIGRGKKGRRVLGTCSAGMVLEHLVEFGQLVCAKRVRAI